ncbi:hypothetical protein CIHG_10154 [Coccidioides immitis H538.4]|uniref:Uncharacterized protein n=1 Tax=Coccidioides immitis H538.4 TaxID=396776 RepID=A0A0J8UWQ1_COCIT|nr:hypothetical protein CIHG_10154 [Coccidioides immitis H538.4]
MLVKKQETTEKLKLTAQVSLNQREKREDENIMTKKLLVKVVLKDMCTVKKIAIQIQKIKDLICKKNCYKKGSFNLLASLSNLLQSDNYAAEVCKNIKMGMKKFMVWKEKKSILYRDDHMYISQNEIL